MNRNVSTLGFWASFAGAVLFIVFTICFAGIALTQESALWTDLNTYLVSAQTNSQIFKQIAQFCILAFTPLYLIILQSLKALNSSKKLFSEISISFGIVFATLVSLNYFLQLTAVRFAIDKNLIDGLEQWIMFNPNSIILSINMLGFSFFFGLSSLFIAPAVDGKGIQKALSVLFSINGILCLSGGIGFVIENLFLVNLTINIGMGGIVTAITILLAIYFKRLSTQESRSIMAP